MAPETINMLPAVLLGVMVALTLFLLPHLNDETPRRNDEPRDEAKKNDEAIGDGQ